MLHEARTTKVIVVVTWVIGLVLVIAYLCHLRAVHPLEQQSVPGPKDVQATDQTNGVESSFNREISLGRILGENKSAVPPMTMSLGHHPNPLSTPDLSTPTSAVYSVISIIEQGATDKLPLCFINETQDKGNNLYPRYLGQPVELVDVAIDGESALVIWNAMVHTEFSLDGTNRYPGEKITLTTRLRRVENLWKLLRLHEGSESSQQ